MKYKMNEMMMIYQNELDKVNNEIIWLKQEIKNKEKELIRRKKNNNTKDTKAKV
jgi:hypothetical protein